VSRAKSHAAGASEPHAAAAARDALARGNAVDAVLTGVLVAAAESPSVFLGPMQLLVGGGGAGLRAVDGRTLQPGRGIPRPRGFLAGERVPSAAFVAVPGLPAAVATCVASLGATAQRRIVGPAVDHAQVRSVERAQALQAFATRGAAALVDPAIAGELLAAAGRAAHGLLTMEDLGSVRPAIASSEDRTIESGAVWTVPWRTEDAVDASTTHVVAAIDARGMAAVACYEVGAGGLDIPALGLRAPAFAAPVMRGARRVSPGTPRPASAPIALRAGRGVAEFSAGLAEQEDADVVLARLIEAVLAAGATAASIRASAPGRVVAVLRAGEGASVLASS
jgi:gamma-glutamyltranspeptidase/glutathione hydrolase